MAPDVLPKVWAELQARIDICSVAREILGHFAIKCIGEAPSSSDSFSLIVWMKVIYDLQRTYLQSSDPSSETLSYLLPPRILIKTLRHVLEVRSQLRPAEPQNYPAQQPRYFAAQTLLSGVRALQLRGISENSPDLDELHAIEILIQKWVGETDEASEKFMLNKCHSGLVLMRSGTISSSVWNKPACNVFELRDNAMDLYPALTKKTMNDLNLQLSEETNNMDPQDHFWARFDIIWAVEAGYIQWCADKLLGKNVIDDTCEVGNIVRILEETTPDRNAMSILNHTWHNRKHGQVHTARVDPDPLQVDIDEELLTFCTFLQIRRAKLVDYNSEIRKLSTTLAQNIESWIRRASGYGKYVDLRGGEQSLKTAYVLGCPMLHVVPEHQLKSSIHESYGNNEQIFLNNPELLDLTECPIYCPRCSSRQSATVIKHARRVDPLNTLSNQLEHLVGTSITPQDSNVSQQLKLWRENKIHWPPSEIQEVESVPAQRPEDSTILGIPSPPSSPNPQPLSPSSSIDNVERVKSNKSEESKSTRTTGTSRFSKIFRRKSSIPSDIVLDITQTAQKHNFNSYCFSSNGKMLMLWNSHANHVYCSVVPTEDSELETSWDWMKFGNGLGSVELVASGKTRIAIISKEEKKSRLLVFGVSTPPNLEPILERVLPRDKKLINKSLCMSPDGGIVAVGTDKEVLVYHINNSINNAELKPRIIKLSGLFSGMDVFSQCMNFSQDCRKLVIATRYYNDGNCEIEIMLYDLLGGQELPGIKTKPHLFTSTDNGLTAVFYDRRKKEILLTGAINKSYGNVYSSRRNTRPIYWPPESSKIQAAVAYPSESQYIFLGSSGGLYSVDLDEERSRKRPSRFGWENKYSVPETPTRSESSTGFVALAVPDVDRIYTFRMEKEEMILELIQGKGAPTRLGFVGPPPLTLDV